MHVKPVKLISFRFGFLTLEAGTAILSRNISRNYHYSLHNNAEERSSRRLRGENLKSRSSVSRLHIEM